MKLRGRRSATVLPPAREPKRHARETFRSIHSRFRERGGFVRWELASNPVPSLRAERRRTRGAQRAGCETIRISIQTGSLPAFQSAIHEGRDTESILGSLGERILSSLRFADSHPGVLQEWRR